eukprot:gene11301-15161_t
MITVGDENESSNKTIKLSVLVLLCAQNASHALLARYSQGILKEDYSSTEVVLVAEIIKLVITAYLAVYDGAETDAVGSGFYKLLWLLIHSRKIILLVVLYSVGNLLAYYSLARVDAAVYTVLLQLKIFSTAFFAVSLLNRNISSAKWRALLLLVLGCILVASPAYNRPIDCESLNANNGNEQNKSNSSPNNLTSMTESMIGMISVLVMVTISGYSAIYFESMLKKAGEKVTIWERNFQLAFYSALLLIAIMVYEYQLDENRAKSHLIVFDGWTIHTVLLSLLQAAGGLLVAATLKYADAILKTLATSGAIVISAILGYMLLGGVLDIFVAVGCISTILAIFNYSLDA